MNIRIILLGVTTTLASQPVAAQQMTRVRANNAPDWGPHARLVEELSIADSRPDYTIRIAITVAADDSGSFYVYDYRDTQIRRYDARGVFERTIGRMGDRPGEYQVVSGMQVTRDGLLVVFDQAAHRISFFRPDGSVHRAFVIGANYHARGFAVDSAGVHYLTERLPGPREGPEARNQYVRISPAGSVVDSIRHPREVLTPRTGFCVGTADGNRCNFLRQTLVAPWSKGGVITAQSTRYSFSAISPHGSTLVVERAHSEVRVTKEEKAEWLAWSAYMKARSLPGSHFEIPPTKPAIREVFSDDLGRVWVDVYVAAEHRADSSTTVPPGKPKFTWRERTTYDVFSPVGRFLGRLQLPWDTRLLTVRGTRVYLLARESNGYKLVVCKIAIDAPGNVGAFGLASHER